MIATGGLRHLPCKHWIAESFPNSSKNSQKMCFVVSGFQESLHTIETEMKAKRDNLISELITLRITKAKAKENWRGGGGGSMKFTLNWLSCQKIIGINKFKKAKAKAKKYFGGINFTLISVSTVLGVGAFLLTVEYFFVCRLGRCSDTYIPTTSNKIRGGPGKPNQRKVSS